MSHWSLAGRLLDLDHVHLLQELVVPVAELAGTALQDVELGAALEILDERRAVGAAGLADRLEQDLRADVLAPGLLGRLAVALDELLRERLRGLVLEPVYQALPVAESDSRPAAQNGPVSMTPPASG